MTKNFILFIFTLIGLSLFQSCKKDKDTPSGTNNNGSGNNNGPVTASFVSNVTEDTAPFALNLTNTSTGATEYYWTLSYMQSGVYCTYYSSCTSSAKDPSFNIEWPSIYSTANVENTASLTLNVKLEAKNAAGSQFANKTITIKNPKACARNSTATQSVTITSSNPYRFYVDNNLQGTISGQSSKSFTIPSGIHTLKVEQVSGYLMYPTVVTTTSNIATCGSYTWTPAL